MYSLCCELVAKQIRARMKFRLDYVFYTHMLYFTLRGDVKIHLPRLPSTAAIQGQPRVRCPDLQRVSQPFRASYLLGYGSRSLSYNY